MSVKLIYIKKYLELKPLAKITLTSGSDEEYQTEVFSCLNYIYDFKNIQRELFIEIEENSFDNNYDVYFNKYDELLDQSIIDIPIVSSESMRNHFKYFQLIFKDFDSLYILLVNQESTFYLGQEWIENNNKEEPKGLEEWVKIQMDIFHFTKRKSVEMLKKFLLSNRNKFNNQNRTKQNRNFYPRIFKTEEAFSLFTSYQKTVKNNLADYSFIYRILVKDDLMHDIKEREFRTWLDDEFEIAIDQLKQLQNCSSHSKSSIYTILKDRHISKI